MGALSLAIMSTSCWYGTYKPAQQYHLLINFFQSKSIEVVGDGISKVGKDCAELQREIEVCVVKHTGQFSEALESVTVDTGFMSINDIDKLGMIIDTDSIIQFI